MPQTDFEAYRQQLRTTTARLGKELPGPMGAFGQLHSRTFTDGALSTKHKELTALAIAVAVRCEGCIAFHVHNCLENGATRQEILETLSVAIDMSGGPGVVYACEAFEALEQYTAGQADSTA
jgi:AhpD family alkylhydroperoxidase